MSEPGESEPDGVVAARLASETGEMLTTLRVEKYNGAKRGRFGWIEDVADAAAHDFLIEQLADLRPHDGVLSEEGTDDRSRLDHERVWIVDPLDGSSDYGYGAGDWAVHVALVENGAPISGAVAVPSMGTVFSTHVPATPPTPDRDKPIVVTGRSRVHSDGQRLAHALNAELVTCGSAGVKAMLVVLGEVDVYVHSTPLYEWDVCAPAVVAAAAGLHVSGTDGTPLIYNQPRPVAPGFVVCRPEYRDQVLNALN